MLFFFNKLKFHKKQFYQYFISKDSIFPFGFQLSAFSPPPSDSEPFGRFARCPEGAPMLSDKEAGRPCGHILLTLSCPPGPRGLKARRPKGGPKGQRRATLFALSLALRGPKGAKANPFSPLLVHLCRCILSST